MLKQFFSNESGQLSIDWTVLSAVIAGIAIAVLAAMSGGASGAHEEADQRAYTHINSMVNMQNENSEHCYFNYVTNNTVYYKSIPCEGIPENLFVTPDDFMQEEQ